MNLSFSKNCLSLWGLDRSGRGVHIIVRVYLLSIIKFPPDFFSCNNVNATIVQNEVLTGK